LFDDYQQWWEYRRLDNILFVHVTDMKQDLTGDIRRVPACIEVEAPEELLKTVRDATTFASMKANAERLLPHMTDFQGGTHTFINQGTNGRWREALSDEGLTVAAADGRLWELWFTMVPEPGQTRAYIADALAGQAEG